MSNLIAVPGPDERSGRGVDGVAAVINAQRTADRWAERRTLSARAVIVVSAAMACVLGVQVGCGTPAVRLILAAWAAAFASLIFCALFEARACRQVDVLLAKNGGRRIHVAD
jgi:hypothetical protein